MWWVTQSRDLNFAARDSNTLIAAYLIQLFSTIFELFNTNILKNTLSFQNFNN